VAFTINHYEIARAKPGMVLGRPIVNRHGKILLTEGTKLNDTYINRLLELGIRAVDIQEKTLYKNSRIILEEAGVFDYLNVIDQVRNLIKMIRRFEKIPVDNFKQVVESHILPIVESYSAINYLNLERPREEYIFHHCVNVALLSGIIGKWLEYDKNEIAQLTLAGLLHDIGKIKVPDEILNKAGKLTNHERQIVQLHSAYGYRLLTEANLPADVLLGILQHHERLDGSGYPGHFQQSKIHRHAQIIAVADVYDAITADRAYSDKVTPFAAAEVLVNSMFSKLSAAICTTFLTQFENFMLGNLVELKTGQYGEVIHLGNFLNTSPIIIRCENGELIRLNDINQIEKMRPFMVPNNKNYKGESET
jgi:putative nucleotidyltransferase with HDIG domain